METRELVTDAALVGVAGYGAAQVMGKATTFMYEQQSEAARQQEQEASYGVAYEVAAKKTAALTGRALSEDQASKAGMALHYALAFGWVPVYMVARRRFGMASFGAGVASGLSMSVLVDEIGNPLLGFTVTGVIDGVLAPVVTGRPIDGTGGSWAAMVDALRNIGRPGVGSAALSAVDIALWDLKARLLDVSVATLTPAFHDTVAVYGSGGFTSYSDAELREQLGGWVEHGIGSVKMKVGREPDRDEARVRVARSAIGNAGLFVDANGMLFDGALTAESGVIRLDRERPGLGLQLKTQDAESYRVA